MELDRVQIITDLFLDFNRDPYKNKSLVEHYVNKLWDCNLKALKKACSELSSQNDMLPRWRHIYAKYKELLASNNENDKNIRVDCHDCGGSGAIKSVFFGNVEIFSLNFHGDGAAYYNKIIGKCHCVAGENMPSFLKTKYPPTFIKDYAIKLKMDCSYVANKIAIEKSREIKELCSISE